MQKEILDKYPTANVRVYAIWFSMLRTDKRSRWQWTAGVLHDGRAIHFWDEQKIVGRWFSKQLASWEQDNETPSDNNTVWDTFFVFSPGSTWQENEIAPKPISWGSPIDEEQEKLKATFFPLLAK